MSLRLAAPCLVVLIGPSASGKSTWAAKHFAEHQIVSSDRLRALVGEGEQDQRAGTDAFAVLDDVLARRLKRKLVTVVDSLGLDGAKRDAWRSLARRHGVPCYAVAFETPAKECRARNTTVPSPVLTQQLKSFAEVRPRLDEEGFDAVFTAAGGIEFVPSAFARAREAAARQKEQPVTLRFGLQLPRFTWDDSPASTADRLAEIAAAAEDVGLHSLWVMDHFVQIPQVGREWEDMLESWTTLGFLAGHTTRVTLGTLVTGITYRNIAHVAKLAATLDVLSKGRAVCGVGAAWFEREHRLYGWDFPPLAERYALLEDALRLFPLMWGKGAPAFDGKRVRIPEAVCYPRPLQDRIPILVGGSGERTTLRLVAKYADACNLFGDAETVARKVDALHRHCAGVGRDPATISITHLATMLMGEDRADVERLLDERTPSGANRHLWAAAVNAGTTDDQVGRFREIAEAGVHEAIVSLPSVDAAAVARLRPVVEAFGPPPQ